MIPKPPLVLVSGMPGSGKTTLAGFLAARLFLPLVAKDPIKESLCRVHGMPPDRAASMRLGIAAIGVLHGVAARYLDEGVGLVLEAAFVHGVSEPELAVHLERSNAVLVACTLDPLVALERYRARSGTAERHPSHHDEAVLAETGIETWPERFGSLDLDVPRLEVDTVDGYRPSVRAIVDWVEAQIRC